jgi:hypothetical protein
VRSLNMLVTLHLEGKHGFDFTPEQLTSCLQDKPQLRRLVLDGCKEMRSLTFLAYGTLASTLMQLELHNCGKLIPQAELERVHGLHAL